MGFQNTVFGYIETNYQMDQENEQVLANFNFDEKYPFTNIFSTPKEQVYLCSMISFAGYYKNLEDDWGEWLSKFEKLLGQLSAISATVIHNVEDRGTLKSIHYYIDKPLPENKMPSEEKWKWIKWIEEKGKEPERVEIIL